MTALSVATVKCNLTIISYLKTSSVKHRIDSVTSFGKTTFLTEHYINLYHESIFY